MTKSFWNTQRKAGALMVLGMLITGAGFIAVTIQGNIQGLEAAFKGVEGIGEAASAFRSLEPFTRPGYVLLLLGFGVFTVRLGEEGDRIISVLALNLFVVFLVVSVLEGTFHSEVTAWAGREWARTGTVPEFFEPLRQWVNGPIQLVQDRFQGRLKLLITMPMSKGSYAIGVLAFASIQAASTVVLLLTLGFASGVEFDLTLALPVIILPMLLMMAGLTLLLASLAPSAEVGGIINGMVGILPVMLSPVFFTMEQAPLLMRWLGWVSPFRYAADGIMKSLSGQSDIWAEFAILAAFAVTLMVVGIWRMRWRER